MRGIYLQVQSSLRQTRHPSAMLRIASTLAHRGRGERAPYGVMVTGEKSTNQLLGCTKFLIFGLIARGPTSWAT
jgi:hypothetical protein